MKALTRYDAWQKPQDDAIASRVSLVSVRRLCPRRRAVERAPVRPDGDYAGKLALRRKVAGDVCVVCRRSL